MADETNHEEVIAKYKRLLQMARSSLETNVAANEAHQKTIAQKEKQIIALQAALEEEKSFRSRRNGTGTDDATIVPRNILRRVDVEGIIWVLIEYDGCDDNWQCFRTENELDDFIARVSGVPITKPPKCLTPAESQFIENECKKKLDAIVEEFRRYKVRTNIALKQSKSPGLESMISFHPESCTPPASNPVVEEEILKWKTAYEKVIKENEHLKTRGGDALVLQQWKQRYETCLQEKEDLSEKLKIYYKMNNSSSAGGLGLSSKHGHNDNVNILDSSRPIEQLYIDLKDEYKEFRRRTQSLEKQRLQEIEELRNALGQQMHDSEDDHSSAPARLGSHGAILQSNVGSSGGILTENKIAYLRQMVIRYLSCKDPVVRPHIESALVAMLRVTPDEKQCIEERQRDEAGDVSTSYSLSSITSFLGSLGV